MAGFTINNGVQTLDGVDGKARFVVGVTANLCRLHTHFRVVEGGLIELALLDLQNGVLLFGYESLQELLVLLRQY